jgi:hypothetical protein
MKKEQNRLRAYCQKKKKKKFIYTFLEDSIFDIQSVMCRKAASISPRCYLEMQSLGPHEDILSQNSHLSRSSGHSCAC